MAGRGGRGLIRRRFGPFPVACALLAPLLAGCAGGLPPGACKLGLVATLPLARSTHVVVEGRLNQQPARFVLDTGAEASHVTPAAVQRFSLQPARGGGRTLITGVGGTVVANNVVAALELGGAEVRKAVSVVDLPVRTGEGAPFVGLLGSDLLSRYDMELSVPERTVRLWDAENCTGDYAAWPGAHWSVPLRRTIGGRLQAAVSLDGTKLIALVDTGANVSIVTAPVAARLGLTPDVLQTDRHGRGQGVDGNPLGSSLHRFADFRIGPEEFRQPRLVVSTATVPQADMLLGLDWMRTRRVWISWSSRQMFVQPLHAPPPPPTPAEPRLPPPA